MNITKVISSEIDSLKRRIVKFLLHGKNDVQTAYEAMPWGFDGNPAKDFIAIYSPTADRGKSVIIGYINKNQLAEVGELRLFSTDQNGGEKTYVWLKNDGTIELGGDTNFAVKYNELKDAFDDLKQKWNTFAAAYAPGGPSSVGLPPTASQCTADISQAKNEKIKTN